MYYALSSKTKSIKKIYKSPLHISLKACNKIPNHFKLLHLAKFSREIKKILNEKAY